MTQSLQLFLFGTLAAAGNLLGGWLIARSHKAERSRLKFLLAFGAGFMLAAVILEVIPESLQKGEQNSSIPMIWLLTGYLLIQLVEHTIAPHFHFGEEVHNEEMQRHGVAATAVAALAIHAFFDGVTIASGLLTNFRLGLILFIAVLLHKVPEGFTVASIMMSAGRSGKTAIKATTPDCDCDICRHLLRHSGAACSCFCASSFRRSHVVYCDFRFNPRSQPRWWLAGFVFYLYRGRCVLFNASFSPQFFGVSIHCKFFIKLLA